MPIETPAASKIDWVGLATGRLGKLTALLAAILLVLSQIEQVHTKLAELFGLASRPCVTVDKVSIPATIDAADWERSSITITGRNNCSRPIGLYVTFTRRTLSEPTFLLRGPRQEGKECAGYASLQVPQCWDSKKPITIAKGPWTFTPGLPGLEQLRNPHPDEKIDFQWEVRDFDEPAKPPIATDHKEIHVLYKADPS